MPNQVFDSLGAFPQGMDSGKDAFLLDREQLSFAVNTTVRGDYATNRPAYQIHTLTGTAVPAATSALFQGACYYAPDTGSQMLVAQIGGRLFTFTPAVTGFTTAVNEVTIPGDPNPATNPQAWLEQAEKWVIVNNGVNNPIYFDGTSSRRAVQGSSKIATTEFCVNAGDMFVTPPIGGQVSVTLTAPLNPIFLNQSIQLIEYDQNFVQTAVTSYAVVAIGGTTVVHQITLRNLGDANGVTQGAESNLVIQPSNLGNVFESGMTYTLNSGIYSNIQMQIQLSSPLPASMQVGSLTNIAGDSTWFLAQTAPLVPGTNIFLFHHPNALSLPAQPGVGDNIWQVGNNQPFINTGSLAQSFTVPPVGSTVTTSLNANFTYPNGTILFINEKQYQVVNFQNVTTGGSANSIILQNINDTRTGHVFNQCVNPSGGVQTTSATLLWNFPELPPGRMLAYGMGRVWESLTDGISFIAGDEVGDPSGSPVYNYRDAVLKTSENSFINGGGSFKVPSNLGQITALCFTAQLDASLGQGPLMVVTPGGVFSCNTPTDRTTWSSLTNPILSESLIGLGGLAQNSTIVVNGDMLFRSVDGIRSLIMARRDFWSWGNTPISFEVSRILDKDNPTGLPFGSGAQFDNRMLMTTTPTQGGLGVYNPGLVALNFDPISSLQGKANSVWDGLWTGINVLQILEGQFNGVHRSFAFTMNTATNAIEFYEITRTQALDNGTSPITWSFETPFTFKEVNGKEFYDLVSLDDGEFYVEDIAPGTDVHFKVQYRPDFSSCWYDWHEFDLCADPKNTTMVYGARLGLGRPPSLTPNTVNSTAANFGRWFQYRFMITGHCVFKGMKVMASIQPQPNFARPLPNSTT